MKDYKLITKNTENDLEFAVNWYLAQGFVLVGGPFYRDPFYIQAVVKESHE